ncbi:hypothetical protein DMR_32510 [Solidesulfovibrio magneticus RS-1]|uniref:Uncharacterized protein n=1 Tax=Solidesulfovibrio magneticus (strain ATCC 700980 / DSM 13731 / RS-1) TaxID=573370 RepID=C4XJJ2_SOLM1|nr:hypothetical protein DMR_32510 [Solidesulfovibrio magneticus RS-1]
MSNLIESYYQYILQARIAFDLPVENTRISHQAPHAGRSVLKIPGFDFSIFHHASNSEEFIAKNSHFADCGLKTSRFKKCDTQISPEKSSGLEPLAGQRGQ